MLDFNESGKNLGVRGVREKNDRNNRAGAPWKIETSLYLRINSTPDQKLCKACIPVFNREVFIDFITRGFAQLLTQARTLD